MNTEGKQRRSPKLWSLAAALLLVALAGCKDGSGEPKAENASGGEASGPESHPKAAAFASLPSADAPFTVPEVDVSAQPALIQEDIGKAVEAAKAEPADPAAVGKLGMYCYVYDYLPQAEACFLRAAALDHQQLDWLYYLALTHQKHGNTKKALEALEMGYAANDTYGPLLVAMGDLIRDDDPRRAMQLYERAVEIDYADARAHFGIAWCQRKQRNKQQAAERFAKAVEQAPEYAAAHEALSELLKDLGRDEEARQHKALAEERAGQEPPWRGDMLRRDLLRLTRSAESLAEDAIRLAEQGEHEQAQELIDQAFELDPKNPLATMARGLILGQQGKYEEAVEAFQHVLEINDDIDRARLYLSRALLELGRLEEAEKPLREILAKAPRDASTLEMLADITLRQGKIDESIALQRKLIESVPNSAALRFRLADTLLRADKVPEAVGEAEQGVELDRKSPAGHFMLGLLYQRSGNRDGSIREFEETILLDPGMAEAYVVLSQMAWAAGDYQTAFGHIDRGLKASPDSPAMANALAWMRATCPSEDVRNGEEAVRLAEKLVQTEAAGQEFSFYDTLAAAYAEVGRFEDAIEAARKAISIAEARGQTAAAERYRQRLAMYEQGQPFREGE